MITNEDGLVFNSNLENATLKDIKILLSLMNLQVVIPVSCQQNSPDWYQQVSYLEKRGVLIMDTTTTEATA